MDIASLRLGGVMERKTAWMTRMKLAALPPPASQASSSVRVKGYASPTPGCVTMSTTVRMAQTNSIAVGQPAQAIRSHAPVVNVSRMNSDVTTRETAQTELTRETAITQRVRSLLVPMEPATTLVKYVMGKLIAETPLTRTIALRYARRTSFNVAVGSASLMLTSVTMTMIVKTAVMKILAPIRPAEATSSLAPVATALVKTGFVMERMTVQIMEMKMDVKAVLIIFINVTLVNGLVQGLENASQLEKFVMGLWIVQQEKMKATSLKDKIVM